MLLAPPRGSGAALPLPTRAFFEPRLGNDFSRVRVHTDEAAKGVTADLGARALTAGDNLYFKEGTYAPGTPAGQRLLAHELTHVVQHRRLGVAPASRPVSQRGDAAEREADVAARVVTDGGRFDARATPEGQVSRDDDNAKTTVPPLARGWSPTPQPPGAPPQSCFEDSSAGTLAGAPAAFDKFIGLTKTERRTVLSITYANGSLSRALAALGAKARDVKYATVVNEILRWIEETETRKTTGKSDAEMAKLQAGFIKADPKVTGGDWGGVAKTKTRWAGLLEPAQKAWTARANAAISKTVTYASTKAPELKLKAATFEFDAEAMDEAAKFAVAAVGSKSGETILVGFEFVTQAEVDPGYVMSTVVHELFGHPRFNSPSPDSGVGRTYQGDLFKQAAGQTPAGTVADPEGTQTYNYWSSEMYSWLLMIPYYKATAAGDTAKVLETPGKKSTMGKENEDPARSAEGWMAYMMSKWEPSLAIALMRGFFKRLVNDPGVQKASINACEGMVKRVFGADAAQILK
jgi:hypothetical protein